MKVKQPEPDPNKPHQCRSWRAVAGKNAGKLGDKRVSWQKPDDTCVVCTLRRDNAIHR